MGVLVAISIPIFTGQLRKARLATNQANARSAYAAAVAKQLEEADAGTAITEKTFIYVVSAAKISEETGDTAYKHVKPEVAKAIASWTVDDKYDGASGSHAAGDSVAKKWTVSFNAKGEFEGVTGSFTE